MLERLGAVSAIGLDLPADITYERYEALMVALGRAHRAVAWVVGDGLIQGEGLFPERYAQAAEATKLAPQTLMNYASVARRVPKERRRPGIPFGVHAEVASLPPAEQVEWLDRVVANDWRREELRQNIRPVSVPPAVVVDLEEAARDLIRSAQPSGDDYVVRRASFQQLCAALGEET